MFKLNRLYLLVMVTPLVLAGCFEYDQEMIIKKDGSGKVGIHYNAPAQELAEEGGGLRPWAENLPKLPISEKAIVDSFGGAPLVVENVRIAAVDDYPDVSYLVKFENVEDLNGRGIFNFEGGTFGQTFSLREDDGDWMYEQSINFDWPMGEDGDYGYYLSRCSLTFQLEVPGKIVESNGTPGPDNTVRWEYTLAELLNTETTLWLVYSAPGALPVLGTTKKIGKWASWGLGAIILCAFIAAPILLTLLKRDKFLFMGTVIKVLEKGSVYKIAVGVILIVLAVGIVLLSGVLYLFIWSEAVEMAGIWQYATFAYAVILGIFTYMAAHATVMRAKSILELPENPYMVMQVMARVFRLAGELVACWLLALAILCAGEGLLQLVAGKAKPIGLTTLTDGPGDSLTASGLLVAAAFGSLLVLYFVGEFLTFFGNISKEPKLPKKGDSAV